MPSSSDGKARARVQSVDSGVESVVVPVLLQQQVVLQGLTAALKELHDDVAGRRSDDSDYSVTHRLAEAGRSGRLLGGGLSGLKGGGGRRRGNNDFYVGGDSVVAPPADHELKAAEEVARISQGDRDAEAAPAADP